MWVFFGFISFTYVEDWTVPGGGGSRKLKVRSSVYSRAAPGGEVRLTVRAGGLGLPWIEALEPAGHRRAGAR